jgi:glycosyltransferase involved in cell wall biosynthesis
MLSIVVPTYNEGGNVRAFYERMVAVLDQVDLDAEIIFSVDPSTDGTEEAIRELHSRDARVKMLRFSRRFGQPAATLAGMNVASGDACVVIDCDLQDPPELILEMVARWREGFDVVYAQRRSRKGETLAKRAVSAVGYRVIRRVAEVDIPENTGDFRLMSRRVVRHVVAMSETHGFLRGLVAVVGFPQTQVLYDRDPRVAGKGKYNRFLGSLAIGMNGIVSFSRHPLHVISLLGIGLSLFACLFGTAYVISKIAGAPFPAGNATIVFIVSFFSGIQLLSLGVMGEYVGRIYDEVKRRPLYIVESTLGLDWPTAEDEPLVPARERG